MVDRVDVLVISIRMSLANASFKADTITRASSFSRSQATLENPLDDAKSPKIALSHHGRAEVFFERIPVCQAPKIQLGGFASHRARQLKDRSPLRLVPH